MASKSTWPTVRVFFILGRLKTDHARRSTFAIEFYNTTRGTWPWLAYGNDRGEGGSQDASMLDPRKAARPGIITARVKVPLRRYSWRNAFHFFFSARLVHARSPGNVKRLNQSSELACVPKKKLSLFLSLSLVCSRTRRRQNTTAAPQLYCRGKLVTRH